MKEEQAQQDTAQRLEITFFYFFYYIFMSQTLNIENMQKDKLQSKTCHANYAPAIAYFPFILHKGL